MDSTIISKHSLQAACREAAFFRKRLLKWYAGQSRFYPWTGIKDPYKVWLSEIILQQTRVEQGLPYYNKILETYPSICDLAGAKDQQVFRMWQGLGYYNRCKNMLAAARMICKENRGKFPETYDSILQLPGIGPYTAAAVASFAFDLPEAVVDGNVERVLARYFNISTPVNSGAGKKQFRILAQQLLDRKQPARYNQALMDLGATVCLPRSPVCESCPLQTRCKALVEGNVHKLPVKKAKKPVKQRHFHYYVFEYKDQLYIRKRTEKDIWQNLHEFVLRESRKAEDEKTLLKDPFYEKAVSGNALHAFSPLYIHKLTHQNLHIRFLLIRLKNPPELPEMYFPVPVKKIGHFAFPKPLVRFLEEMIKQ